MRTKCSGLLCAVALAWIVTGVALGDEDAASQAIDASPPSESLEAEHGHGELTAEAEVVFRATLAKGVSFIPAPKRVVNTAYVFHVKETLKGELGQQDAPYVTVYDTGGVLRDGRKMDTVDSFRLFAGDEYLVFARHAEGEYWLSNVLQIDDAQNVADASGRVVTGIAEGRVILSPRRTHRLLRYTVPIEIAPPEMDKGPTSGSLPVSAPAEASAPRDGEPLKLEVIERYIQEAAAGTLENASIPVRPKNGVGGESPGTEERGEAEPRDFSAGAPEFVLSGHHVAAFQSHYHFMPNDNNWGWTHACRGAWDVLVEPKGGFRLFAYKINSDGTPIRNRAPVADNDLFNVGVLSNAQMTSGGYDTWTSLGANGVCYRWWNSSNHLIETDILINPAIAADEVQFRKSFTHEFGHALTLDHEQRYMALMFPGTFRQPPNYSSTWYTRRDDHRGVRAMLEWVNSNIGSGTWNIAQFADPATWSQAHPNPGTNGSDLVMTSISDRSLSVGDTATMRNVHVENRGTQAANNVTLKFYLSTNNIISSGDREMASYTWSAVNTYWTGDLNVRVPSGTPNGDYFVGWRLTTNSAEPSTANNTALLLNDRTSAFSEIKVRIQ